MATTLTLAKTRTASPSLAEVHDLTSWRDDRHDVLVSTARELMLEGKEPDALVACFDALRVKADSYEALALAGTLLAILDDPEASVVYTREAIRQAPGRPDAYYDLGSTLLDLGRPGEALGWLETGIRLLGDRTDDLVDFLYSARVECLTFLGRYAEAEAVLGEARARTEDVMGLLDAADEGLRVRRRRPALRLVPTPAG